MTPHTRKMAQRQQLFEELQCSSSGKLGGKSSLVHDPQHDLGVVDLENQGRSLNI